jgi:hypothetical protein
MAKTDKDKYLKDLAIKLALARGMVPIPEVLVRSVSDLSDSTEVLTDLDVLGIENAGDGGLRRVIFDCKSSSKLGAVSRAFWAAGVRDYTRCDEAIVVMNKAAVSNHRISALVIDVDLHDERSFKELGRTSDPAFPSETHYQSSIDGWFTLSDKFSANAWSVPLFDLSRNVAPLSQSPTGTFRKILAELRAIRGNLDPAKDAHVAIFMDALASAFILWASLGRGIRRFYDPSMDKASFEKILRYYLWGGKENYLIRQQLHDKVLVDGAVGAVELPKWTDLVSFASLTVSAPQNVFECALVCRELAIRLATQSEKPFDAALTARLKSNTRIRQFSLALSDYLVDAGGLPKDLGRRVQQLFASF